MLIVLIEPPAIELLTREVLEVPISITSKLNDKIANRAFKLVSKVTAGEVPVSDIGVFLVVTRVVVGSILSYSKVLS
jgi:hypothetical protein